jgi:hypothetical protein
MLNRDDIRRLSEQAAAHNNLVEAGWISYRLHVIPPEIDPGDVELMRMAYFGGAVHLLADLVAQLRQAKYEPVGDFLGHLQRLNRELLDYIDDIDCSG